jgi:hypothetical protein
MHFLESLDFRPGTILVFLILQIFGAIYGRPHVVFRVSPTDMNAVEHSKAFFRSWRALALPLICWIGDVLGSGVVDWFRQSDQTGHLWSYTLLFCLILGLGGYLGWITEKRLIRSFMNRYRTEKIQANKSCEATGDNVSS